MSQPIITLQEFYGSPRGVVAAAIIGKLVNTYAPATGTTVIFGYAPPTMLATLPHIALMPAAQGVCAWPDNKPNRAALTDESAWPLPDQSADTIIIMHALEACANPAAVLAEAWRVLKSSGRLILIVPNRRGLWARAESTPFGNGQPFSALQLRTLLRAEQFVPQQWHRTLFTPPFKSATLLRTAPVWEKLGALLTPSFGGVLVMGASKQIYAATPRSVGAKRLNLIPPLLTPVNTRQ